MKRLNDFFAAGIIIGIVANIVFGALTFVIVPLLGIPIRQPWNDMASLFFKPPEVNTVWAQVYGFLGTFGVSVTNCIIIGGILRSTGRHFAYLKSMVVCSANVMFGFMILYPSLGLVADQHSISTTYYSLILNEVYAIFVAYLFLHKTDIGL
jgi:Na+-driven multidrug efflux pump